MLTDGLFGDAVAELERDSAGSDPPSAASGAASSAANVTTSDSFECCSAVTSTSMVGDTVVVEMLSVSADKGRADRRDKQSSARRPLAISGQCARSHLKAALALPARFRPSESSSLGAVIVIPKRLMPWRCCAGVRKPKSASPKMLATLSIGTAFFGKRGSCENPAAR